jgi:hypothetical protein
MDGRTGFAVSFLIELAHPTDDWTDKDVLHMQKDLASAVLCMGWAF